MAISRRAFLAASAGTIGGLALGACGVDEPRQTSAAGTTSRPTLPPLKLSADPFTLGVASGDPLASNVVLWTRLAPAPTTGGLAGMPDAPVDVTWQVATDEAFTSVVTSGTARTESGAAHSVHVDAGGLAPSTDYYYRFTAGGFTSPVGRTRTFAGGDSVPDHLRVGVVTCQDFGTGYYAAYRHLLDEDLHLVVHLGDYIYEHDLPIVRSLTPPGTPTDLDGFRSRYAAYKADADLRAAHARYPFLVMWDDHEVTNNYAGNTGTFGQTADDMREMRAAAYRAWWEHMPVRVAPPTDADVDIYRSVKIGGLARISLLDERQYADVPPCRDSAVSDTGDCPARAGNDREYLGPKQQSWFAQTVAPKDVVWDLVGNPTVVAGVNAGTLAAPAYYLETWDGYPQARRRFIESLRTAGGQPVVLTGDYHAGMVADIHETPGDTSTAVVTTELMTPAVTSVPFPLPRETNPHIHYATERHGYLTLDVEPTQITATFRLLDDIAKPDTAITTGATWRIAKGAASATPVA